MTQLEEIAEKLEPLLGKARDVLESEEVRTKVDQVKKTAKSLVDNYPVGSIVGAVAIGYLIGKLLKDDD